MDLINFLRCYDCDKELDQDEIYSYNDFDGMCENCYSISMEAAYEDIKDLDFFDFVDLEDD